MLVGKILNKSIMFYDNLSSILDQSQLSSSKRLEMTSFGRQPLKFNNFKISGFREFFENFPVESFLYRTYKVIHGGNQTYTGQNRHYIANRKSVVHFPKPHSGCTIKGLLITFAFDDTVSDVKSPTFR